MQVGVATGAQPALLSFNGQARHGKTTVAERISEILHGLGYGAQGPSGHCHPDDLVRPVTSAHRPRKRARFSSGGGAGDGRRAVHCDRGLLPLPPENENGITAPKRSRSCCR